MKRSVYIETSVISYLAAYPSRDVIVAGHQQTTHEWWQTRRERYDLYVSELVLEEASGGDPDAARRRIEYVASITELSLSEPAVLLARRMVEQHALPSKAVADALHVAIAAENGVDFLLTWNCRHIANAETRSLIEETCRAAGFKPPIICTPEELLGWNYVE